MNTQDAINLLTKYLEIKKSQGEWSLDGEPLDEALSIVLSQVSSLSPDKLSVEMHVLLTPPLRCFLVPGSKPELKGLEVAFDSDGYMGARCVADRSLGFILTKESAMTLAALINKELENQVNHFALATPVTYPECGVDFSPDEHMEGCSFNPLNNLTY